MRQQAHAAQSAKSSWRIPSSANGWCEAITADAARCTVLRSERFDQRHAAPVQPVEWLIQQPDRCPLAKQPRQRRALALASGEVAHGHVQQSAKPQLRRIISTLAIKPLPERQRLPQWQMRIERGAFIDQPQRATTRNRSGKGGQQPGENPQQAGLAAPVGPLHLQRFART